MSWTPIQGLPHLVSMPQAADYGTGSDKSEPSVAEQYAEGP